MDASLLTNFSDYHGTDADLAEILEITRIEHEFNQLIEQTERLAKYPNAELSAQELDDNFIEGLVDENTHRETLDLEHTVDAGAVVFLDTDRQDNDCCLFLCIFLALNTGLLQTKSDWWEDLDFDDFKAVFGFPKNQRASDQDIRKIAQDLGISIRRSEASDHVMVFGQATEDSTIDVQLFSGHYKLWIIDDDQRRQAHQVLESDDFKRRCGRS
jgi:hypothetical protein